MENTKKLLSELRNKGLRATPVRISIIAILQRSATPLSTQQLLASLSGRPHKTTIYRETEALVHAGLLRSVDAGDGIKRYESASRNHHHHAICTNCRTIAELPASDCKDDLRSAHRAGFFVQDHDVQIFGLCTNCR